MTHSCSPKFTRLYHYQAQCSCGWKGVEHTPPAVTAYERSYADSLQHNSDFGMALNERERYELQKFQAA